MWVQVYHSTGFLASRRIAVPDTQLNPFTSLMDQAIFSSNYREPQFWWRILLHIADPLLPMLLSICIQNSDFMYGWIGWILEWCWKYSTLDQWAKAGGFRQDSSFLSNKRLNKEREWRTSKWLWWIVPGSIVTINLILVFDLSMPSMRTTDSDSWWDAFEIVNGTISNRMPIPNISSNDEAFHSSVWTFYVFIPMAFSIII